MGTEAKTTLATILGFIDDPSTYTIKHDDHEVEFLDEYGLSCGDNGEWYVAGHEFGATHLIHASSFDDAWEAWIDASPTIGADELPEAYGIDDSREMEAWKKSHPAPVYRAPEWSAWVDAKNAEAKRILAQWDDDARNGVRKDWPELIEGYENQSNASGTGIVDVGHYAWMREADLDDVTIEAKEGAS